MAEISETSVHFFSSGSQGRGEERGLVDVAKRGL